MPGSAEFCFGIIKDNTDNIQCVGNFGSAIHPLCHPDAEVYLCTSCTTKDVRSTLLSPSNRANIYLQGQATTVYTTMDTGTEVLKNILMLVMNLNDKVGILTTEVSELRNENNHLREIVLASLNQEDGFRAFQTNRPTYSSVLSTNYSKSVEHVKKHLQGKEQQPPQQLLQRSQQEKVQPAAIPETTAVSTNVSTADEDFTLVERKKKRERKDTAQVGARKNSGLTTIVKQTKEKKKAIFASCFAPHTTEIEITNYLEKETSLKELTVTKLKTRFDSYASFHVEVIESEYYLVNNMMLWPEGTLINEFNGPLRNFQIYTSEKPTISKQPRNAETVELQNNVKELDPTISGSQSTSGSMSASPHNTHDTSTKNVSDSKNDRSTQS